MNYNKVQFISWELNTGPKTAYTYQNFSWQRLGEYYPGICNLPDNRFDVLSHCRDIDARVKFTEAAIKAAAQRKNIDKSSSTLKVFIAPEFLFRGAGGAYLHDLIGGWRGPAPTEFALANTAYASNWPGLFDSLQALVATDDYKDWVFVFGTALSASFATKLTKKTDGSGNVSEYDLTTPAESYNSTLIQLGGKGNSAIRYVSRKHYKSAIDFLQYYAYSNQAFLDGNVKPLDSKYQQYVVETASEGGAVFTLDSVNLADGKPLKFGMEICLDHARSGGINPATNNYRNAYGRLRHANQFVKLQLVPSGGMSLVDASIRLEPGNAKTTNAYAFNCDGLNNLPGQLGNGSHSQLWNGANGAVVPPANKLLEASGGAVVANSDIAAVPTQVATPFGTINANVLWANGSGCVRVVNPLPL